MFLRATIRRKDGKEHRYWSVVEASRVAGGRVVQRPVLQLDRFWGERLPASRKGTRWDRVLFVLVAYRLVAPGSEWRLHREWYARSALMDLLGTDEALADIHALYRCHDRLLEHKPALFDHLVGRWRDLFNASFDVLLYDLASTYFEANPPFPDDDKRRFGYCLHVTLKRRLAALAPGLTPRSVLEKFSAVQMIDVLVPTTDGREVRLTRTTQPEPDLKLLLDKLRLELPAQPPPKISVPRRTPRAGPGPARRRPARQVCRGSRFGVASAASTRVS